MAEFSSMDDLFPSGPSLHDFVSTNPNDLPTFDPSISNGISAENILEYCIYVDPSIKSKPQIESLELARLAVLGLVESICGVDGLEHIWHQDSFQLEIQTATTLAEAHLKGSVGFGDCIDDEWLIVWILSEASRIDPSLSISVRDNDGEFLLIETSPSWPRSLNWLDPDTSHNRVWIRRGSLHIISSHGTQSTVQAEDDDGYEDGRLSLELREALEMLRQGEIEVIDHESTTIRKGDRVKISGLIGRAELNGQVGRCVGASLDRLVVELKQTQANMKQTMTQVYSSSNNTSTSSNSSGGLESQRLKVKPHNLFKIKTTEAPHQVVEAFHQKLDKVKEAMQTNKQAVKMILPKEIAFILYKTPHIVAAAIRTLYCRSPIETNHASLCKRFGSSTRDVRVEATSKSQTLVEVTVIMTRCLLAMLNSQESFHPPKRMVTWWSSQIARSPHLFAGGDNMHAVLESTAFKRGLLLTSSFEMLYQSHKSANGGVVGLGVSGFQVMDDCIRKHCCSTCLGAKLTTLMTEFDECCFCSSDSDWLSSMSKRNCASTDESWMNVSPEELEAILQKAASNPPQVADNQDEKEESHTGIHEKHFFPSNETDSMKDGAVVLDDGREGMERLGKIVDGINTFLNTSSEVSGVEVPTSSFNQTDPGDLPTNTDSSDGGISFDVNKFMSALQGKDFVEEEDHQNIWGDPNDSGSDSEDSIDQSRPQEDREEGDEKDDDGSDDDDSDDGMRGYSAAMQKELDEGVLSQSFERVTEQVDDGSGDSDDSDGDGGEGDGAGDNVRKTHGGDEIKPVDLDANLVKHLLESYASQEGLAGPASNLLHEMGLFFPNKTREDNEDGSKKKKVSEDGKTDSTGGAKGFFNEDFSAQEVESVDGKAISLPFGESDPMYQLD